MSTVPGGAEPSGPPTVDVGVDRCVGCLECGAACASGALRRLPGVWAVQVDPDRCTGCRRCERACPFGAISVTGPARTRRQVILDALRAALASACPGGWQVTSEAPAFPVPFGGPAAVPDLAVVRARTSGPAWLGELETGVPPVPLVVEVVSARNPKADLGPRREAYWRSGVPTFWTVDRRSGAVAVEWSTRPAWFDRWAAFTFG